jgi:predicted CopG family antitoxin
MDTTTIALDREAYDALRNAKRPGESFSAVVKRLARTRRPLSEFAGSWGHLSDQDLQRIRRTLMESRAAAREKVRKVGRSRR